MQFYANELFPLNSDQTIRFSVGKEVSKQRNAKQKIGYIQLQFEKNCTRKKIHIQVCRRRLVLFLHNVTHIQLYIFPNPDP